MDLRSGRRLSSLPTPTRYGARCRRRGSAGADRISALSDDMILLVLGRLGCVSTAVRTGLLSRRWRGLWTRLTDLAFRGVTPATIEAALSVFSTAAPVGTAFNLDIALPSELDARQVADSLLHAAARFSPAELVFTLPPLSFPENKRPFPSIQLPCFHRATSIDLDMPLFLVRPPKAGEFPVLERLSISGRIIDIAILVTLCPRLRVLRAKFRGLAHYEIHPALYKLRLALRSRNVTLSLLDICINEPGVLLLDTLRELSPEQLVYTTKRHAKDWPRPLRLPRVHSATSIEIDWKGISFTMSGCFRHDFSVLERLCFYGCTIVELAKLVSCCPRLRVLHVDGAMSGRDIMIHSRTLQELVLGTYKDCQGIHIVAPVLKQLRMEVHGDRDMTMFVSAPLVEKVSWRRMYTGPGLVLGFRVLQSLSLETTKSYGERVGQDTCLQVQQMPRGHVLSLDMSASDPSDAHFNFAREIEKLPATDISVVDIHLQATGHVYGATLLHLLQAPRVQTAIRILKLTLIRSEKSEVTEACIENCPCDQPNNWRSQNITLKYLEKVEIKGFKGEGHEFDFLKLILQCAQMLKRITLKLENGVKMYGYRGCTKKIRNISMMYPSVNFRVYLSSRRLVLS